MAYRYGNRSQHDLFPASIEDYVAADAPVRVYDAFVDALDFGALGVELDAHQVGNSAYDPRAMLKLLVYGYSYGVRSSRKLEREAHYNLSFIWLMGGLKPDHKTIAEFRRRHRGALKKVLQQCARLCVELDLIAGNTLFVDGSPMRANASLHQRWTPERCRKHLPKIEQRIEEILAECDRMDEQESADDSLVKLKEELQGQQKLRRKVEGVLKRLQDCGEGVINSTDPDCARIRGPQGSHAGYNLQMVVDEKNGLIVHTDVVNENNDLGQFADQLEQAHETLGEPCQTACGDAGYSNYQELAKIDGQQITVVVPSRRQAEKKVPTRFDKSQFTYDRDNDRYICPADQRLTYRTLKEQNKKIYRAGAGVCRNCCYFGECTTSRKTGRKIVRYVDEEFRERLEAQYQQPVSQAIYKLRGQKVELPFGHLKRNLKAGYFLLRRLEGVRAEASLLASCFNLARMITLIGVPKLLNQLAS